ncbi:archaetidylserine decarboxylase [Cohnella lubricantis]|uniref:Phosphatidylserine decarboxylase proenzyme n=1 Tax=Cohnella lubricantis TaxID=2163172 RepID=A0A841TF53_9BACL|nr:archaetidylserine decarboxylase [Cohnella lubricantis]MBB6678926.1 phosphatidylserine decarboxylase [Cohnella lubricantis]MBP2120366.1 phosphatidylserine decarboxylase [Cohnella lubricantis]
MNRWLLRSMTELTSRKFISRLTGRFAKSSHSRRLIPRFAKMYRIPIEEAEKQISEYASLNDFFTRRLKPGSRPIDETPDVLVSPVDARITACGAVENGQLLQVKGQDYTLEELLNNSPRIDQYRGGSYWVLYLSPTDYHRIHSPCAGVIVESEHVPGRVYPVNEFGLTSMRRVLSRNERLVTYMRHDGGEIAVVKVGALNVSSIRYVEPMPKQLERGQELAYFEFGSTVVLLAENGTCRPRADLKPGDKVRMGELLAAFRTKA